MLDAGRSPNRECISVFVYKLGGIKGQVEQTLKRKEVGQLAGGC